MIYKKENDMMTSQSRVPESGARLLLLENEQIREVMLDEKQEWKIGREVPDSRNSPDIIFSSVIVSREHGSLHHFNGQWFYVDNPKNRNGTFHNGKKIPRPMNGTKRPTPLANGDILRIDNEDLNKVSSQGVLMLFSTMPIEGLWETYSLRRRVTLIGSDAICDICEPLSMMSSKHSKIAYINGHYYLSDCGSVEGTFVNGRKISSCAILREKDHIKICGCNMFFLGNKLFYNSRQTKKGKIFRIAKMLGFNKSGNATD